MRLEVRVVGRAGELVRLTDEERAAIVESLAAWFRVTGFEVEVEASFSEWGERGRIDLLAFDLTTDTLVIVEVKSLLLDLQDLFGSLDVKERLASAVGRRRGWVVRRTVTVLAVAGTSANRRIARSHASMFAGFARKRLTAASVRSGERRLLHWVSAGSARRDGWIAGRQRVARPVIRRGHASGDPEPPLSG